MCGIAGVSFLHPNSCADLEDVLMPLGAAIAHRGPDSSGFWADPELGVGLVHQRLAVLDLSSAGHQPMHSPGGRYVLAFNGEIYNHLSLRCELEKGQSGAKWRGHSDTETLLAAIETWGLEDTLQRCNGMWALALVDRCERRIHLARDRFGEKPIYWGISGTGAGKAVVFGSELSALRAFQGFNNRIDRATLTQFLQYGQVPTPLSIYSGIKKLPPG
ncbi:MAG: hypothetical protein VKK05_09660, partial [Synechococcus sp.]|nr:hypothetical protein [Synechococcus sp.]